MKGKWGKPLTGPIGETDRLETRPSTLRLLGHHLIQDQMVNLWRKIGEKVEKERRNIEGDGGISGNVRNLDIFEFYFSKPLHLIQVCLKYYEG